MEIHAGSRVILHKYTAMVYKFLFFSCIFFHHFFDIRVYCIMKNLSIERLCVKGHVTCRLTELESYDEDDDAGIQPSLDKDDDIAS